MVLAVLIYLSSICAFRSETITIATTTIIIRSILNKTNISIPGHITNANAIAIAHIIISLINFMSSDRIYVDTTFVLQPLSYRAS